MDKEDKIKYEMKIGFFIKYEKPNTEFLSWEKWSFPELNTTVHSSENHKIIAFEKARSSR